MWTCEVSGWCDQIGGQMSEMLDLRYQTFTLSIIKVEAQQTIGKLDIKNTVKSLSIYHLTPDIFVLLIYSSASEYQMTRQSLNVYHPPDVHQSLLSRPTGSILVSYKSKLSRLLLPRARCQPWLHCREISEIDLDMHPAKLDHNGSISTRLTKPDDSRLVM